MDVEKRRGELVENEGRAVKVDEGALVGKVLCKLRVFYTEITVSDFHRVPDALIFLGE